MEYRIIYGDGDCEDGVKVDSLNELLKDVKDSAETTKGGNKRLFVVKVESPY